MASSGPNSPSTIVSDNSFGNNAWATPGDADAQDDTYATSSVTLAGQSTEYLKATNFGFSIPSGATIDGIVVEVDKYQSTGTGSTIDTRARIVKGGTIGSTDRSLAGSWDTSDTDTYSSYGGSTDLWGETWSDSDINSSTFGFALAAVRQSGNNAVAVDHIRITVYYTESGGGGGDAQPMAMTQTRFRRV